MNLVGAVVSVAAGMEGGLVGLVVSLVMTVLAVAALVLQGRATPRTA